jgi:hypothetical protein
MWPNCLLIYILNCIRCLHIFLSLSLSCGHLGVNKVEFYIGVLFYVVFEEGTNDFNGIFCLLRVTTEVVLK